MVPKPKTRPLLGVAFRYVQSFKQSSGFAYEAGASFRGTAEAEASAEQRNDPSVETEPAPSPVINSSVMNNGDGAGSVSTEGVTQLTPLRALGNAVRGDQSLAELIPGR